MDYQILKSSQSSQESKDSCGCSEKGCNKTGVQFANISTPIDIVPHVKIDDIDIECIDKPKIECTEKQCKSSLKIVISQKICIKIPVQYRFNTCVGESEIDCECDKY